MFITSPYLLRPMAVVALLALSGLGLAACDEGPAEEAGDAVEDATNN
jgi:hypothetical protein